VSLAEGPGLKDLNQACLFDSKYLACCGDNPSQHISLADSGIAKPTNNTKSSNTLSERFVNQSQCSTVYIKRSQLSDLFVDHVCTFTPLKLNVEEDTQVFVFHYNLTSDRYILTSDRCCRGRCCTLPEVYAHLFGLVGIELIVLS
jgi:hypothetical protein